MRFKFCFWKLCNKMSVESSSHQKIQQKERWEQGLTSPQKDEAHPVFAMCLEILGGKYYLRCKVFLWEKNKAHWLLRWRFCRHSHSKWQTGVPSPVPGLALRGSHTLPAAEKLPTHPDHLLSPTAMGTAAPAPSQLSLEVKEKLKIVSSRHKLKSLLGETW